METVEESQVVQIGSNSDASSLSVEDYVENASLGELSLHYLNNMLVGIEAQYSTPL